MLNVAVAGLGWWGKTVVNLQRGSAKLRPVLLVEPNPAARAFGAQAGVPVVDTLEAALADPKVAAVILCTPHSTHCDQIVAVAKAGKHVFCEKPFCMSTAEVTRALAAVSAAGVTVGVGHERRFETPVADLMRLADSGALGTLLQVEGNFSQDKFIGLAADNWRLSGKEAPAGPLTATGIHMLDLAIRFLGPGQDILARVRQLGSQLVNGDTLGALMTHKSGANSLISAILATPFMGRFAVYGSQGWQRSGTATTRNRRKAGSCGPSCAAARCRRRIIRRCPRCLRTSRPSRRPRSAARSILCRMRRSARRCVHLKR